MKTKKKLSVLLMCVAAVISLACAFTFAACSANSTSDNDSSDIDKLTFTLNESGDGYSVSGMNGDYDSIKIPSEYNGLPVTSIDADAFCECTSLKSVIIPDSVISIGHYAFDTCTALKSVSIPDSVTSLGEWTFYRCTSLTSVVIGDGMTSIGSHAFHGCTALKSVTIPNGVTSIGDSAFRDCSSLTSVTIGNSVTSIGTYAFSSCTALTEINFNATAMDDLSSSNYVFLNAGQNSSGVTVTIRANVTRIPAYLFASHDSISSFDANNITEVVFEKGGLCESIGDYAFAYNCSSLTSITIPDSVTSIDKYAFRDCSSLTSVTIGKGVTSIAHHAFYGCTTLTSVYYYGGSSDWDEISIDTENSPLRSATRYYYSETEPEDDGNFWHYVNGEIVVWSKD